MLRRWNLSGFRSTSICSSIVAWRTDQGTEPYDPAPCVGFKGSGYRIGWRTVVKVDVVGVKREVLLQGVSERWRLLRRVICAPGGRKRRHLRRIYWEVADWKINSVGSSPSRCPSRTLWTGSIVRVSCEREATMLYKYPATTEPCTTYRLPGSDPQMFGCGLLWGINDAATPRCAQWVPSQSRPHSTSTKLTSTPFIARLRYHTWFLRYPEV